MDTDKKDQKKTEQKMQMETSAKAYEFERYKSPWLWRLDKGCEVKLAMNRDAAILSIFQEAIERETLGEGEGTIVALEEVDFDDCWLKWPIKPEFTDEKLREELDYVGVRFDEIIIRPPNSNPGGTKYWIDLPFPILQPIIAFG